MKEIIIYLVGEEMHVILLQLFTSCYSVHGTTSVIPAWSCVCSLTIRTVSWLAGAGCCFTDEPGKPSARRPDESQKLVLEWCWNMLEFMLHIDH